MTQACEKIRPEVQVFATVYLPVVALHAGFGFSANTRVAVLRTPHALFETSVGAFRDPVPGRALIKALKVPENLLAVTVQGVVDGEAARARGRGGATAAAAARAAAAAGAAGAGAAATGGAGAATEGTAAAGAAAKAGGAGEAPRRIPTRFRANRTRLTGTLGTTGLRRRLG
jgi:hypothetical protein